MPTGFDTAGATGVTQMALDNSTYLGGYYNDSAFTGYSVVRENINTGNTEYFSLIPPTAPTSLYYYWH